MAARQFKPFNHNIGKLQLIVYPVRDENPLYEVFDRKDNYSIQEHLDNLYKKHLEGLSKGAYHIVFVWSLGGERMTDVWIHDMENWSDSGPLIECNTFRNLEVCSDAGIASGDSVIVLRREEELRRRVDNLAKYLDRGKYSPIFPEGMEPIESFYK